MNEWIFLGLMLVSGVLGMVAHFWKKLAREQTMDSLGQYIKGNPGFTIRAAVATIGAVAGIWEVTDFAMIGNNITAILTLLTTAFTTGWTFDSMLNKPVTNGS